MQEMFRTPIMRGCLLAVPALLSPALAKEDKSTSPTTALKSASVPLASFRMQPPPAIDNTVFNGGGGKVIQGTGHERRWQSHGGWRE